MLMKDGVYVRVSLKILFDDITQKLNQQFWMQLLASLNAAVNKDAEPLLRGPPLSELFEKRYQIDDCQDKEDFIISLHNSLAKSCYCRCIPACDFTTANIHLNHNDEVSSRIDNISKFNLLFQDRHHIQNSQSRCYWRDVEIAVCAAATTQYGSTSFLLAIKPFCLLLNFLDFIKLTNMFFRKALSDESLVNAESMVSNGVSEHCVHHSRDSDVDSSELLKERTLC
jgi:hypothetical protein